MVMNPIFIPYVSLLELFALTNSFPSSQKKKTYKVLIYLLHIKLSVSVLVTPQPFHCNRLLNN